MRNKVFSICGIICCVMLILGIIYDGVSSEYRETTEKVEVVNKSYDPNLAMQLATKTYPLEFGDTIEVTVTKSFDKDGKMKNTEISIED